MGIPIPRLAYMPSLNSRAARRTMRSLMATAGLEDAALFFFSLRKVKRCRKGSLRQEGFGLEFWVVMVIQTVILVIIAT